MSKRHSTSLAVRKPNINRIKHLKIHGVVRPKLVPGSREVIALTRYGEPTLFYHIQPETTDDGPLCLTVLQGLFEAEKTQEWGVSVLLSAYMQIIRESEEKILYHLTNAGYEILPIYFPSDPMFEDYDLKGLPIISKKEMVVFYGQLMFYPFKNFSAANYTAFVSKRTQAMNAMVGFRTDSVRMPMSLECAIRVKREMAGCNEVKKEMLYTCIRIAKSTEPSMALISNYMLGILDWVDMTAYGFILTALFRPGSPVLWHPSVAQEVENFLQAVIHVGNHDLPQYFKVLCDPTLTFYVERNRFPILFSVAAKVINDQYKSVMQMQGVGNVDENLVKNLYNLHLRWMGKTEATIPLSILPYMTTRLQSSLVTERKHLDWLHLGASDADTITRATVEMEQNRQHNLEDIVEFAGENNANEAEMNDQN